MEDYNEKIISNKKEELYSAERGMFGHCKRNNFVNPLRWVCEKRTCCPILLPAVAETKQLSAVQQSVTFAEIKLPAVSFTKGWNLADSAGPVQKKKHWRSHRNNTRH